jgi:hypothetical protein
LQPSPIETEHEARQLVRHITDSPPGSHQNGNLRHLEEACRTAGIRPGAYEVRVMVWLSTWEPQIVAVVASLITRAAATGAQR